MKTFIRIILFSFLSLSFFAFAQESLIDAVHIKGFYGNAIGKVSGVESNYINGVSVGVSKDLHPEAAEWIDKLNAKKVNLSLVYANLDGVQQGFTYGKGYAISSNIDFELLRYKPISVYISPEVGLSYMTKTISTNPETYIFGSHFNFYFGFGISAEYRFSKNWSINPYTQIIHYSNGALRLPNAGLNALVYGVGINKKLENFSDNPKFFEKRNDSLKTNALELAAGIGWRGKYRSKDSFFRSGFYVGYSHYFNSYFALRGGTDIVYYAQVYNPEEYEDTIPYWGKSYEHFRAGLSIGAEIKFGKLALNANMGRYVYMKSPYNQKIYWNAAFRYYLCPKFGIQAGLHAHKFQADFLNFGLFFRI